MDTGGPGAKGDSPSPPRTLLGSCVWALLTLCNTENTENTETWLSCHQERATTSPLTYIGLKKIYIPFSGTFSYKSLTQHQNSPNPPCHRAGISELALSLPLLVTAPSPCQRCSGTAVLGSKRAICGPRVRVLITVPVWHSQMSALWCCCQSRRR